MADEKVNNEQKQNIDFSKLSLEDNQRLLLWIKKNLAGEFKKDVAAGNAKLGETLTREIRDSGKKTRSEYRNTGMVGKAEDEESRPHQESFGQNGVPEAASNNPEPDADDTSFDRARGRKAKTLAERLQREQTRKNQSTEAEGLKGQVATKSSIAIGKRIDSIIRDLRSPGITKAIIDHHRILLGNLEQEIHKNVQKGPPQDHLLIILGRARKVAAEAHGKFARTASNAAKHIAKSIGFNRNTVLGAFVSPNMARVLNAGTDFFFGSSEEKKQAAALKRARETEGLTGSKEHAERFTPLRKTVDQRFNSPEEAIEALKLHEKEPALDALQHMGPGAFKTPEHHQHALDAVLKRPDVKTSTSSPQSSGSSSPTKTERRPKAYSVKNILIDWETNEKPTEEQIRIVRNEYSYQYHGVSYKELVAKDKPDIDKHVNRRKTAQIAKLEAESKPTESSTSPKPVEKESPASPTPETPKAERNAAPTAPPTPSIERPVRLSPDALKKAEESRYNDAIALAKKSGGNLRHSELRSGLNLDFQSTTALYDKLQKDGHLGTEDGTEDGAKSPVATTTTSAALPPKPAKTTPVAEDVSRALPLTINEQLRANVQKRREAEQSAATVAPPVVLPAPTTPVTPVEPTEKLVKPPAKKKRAVRTGKAKPKSETPAAPSTEIPIVPYITPTVTGGITKPIFGEKPIAQRRRGKKISENQTSFFPIGTENSPKREATSLGMPPKASKALKIAGTIAGVGLTAASGGAAVPVGKAIEEAVAKQAIGAVESKITQPHEETTSPIREKLESKGTDKIAEKLSNKPEPAAEDLHPDATQEQNTNTNTPIRTAAAPEVSSPISAPGATPEQSGSSPARMDEMAKGFAGLHHDLTRIERLTEAQLNELKEIAKNSAREDEEEQLAADAERRKGHETELGSGRHGEKDVGKKGGGLFDTLLTALFSGIAGKVFGNLLRKFGIGGKVGEVAEAGGVTKKAGGIFSKIKERFGLGKASEGAEAVKGTEGIAKAEGFMGRVVGGAENVAGGVKVASKVATGGAELAKGAEGLTAIAEASSFMGKLSKFTGITKLLGFGRLAGKIFLPLTILMGVFDFFSGFSHAGDILGKKGKLDVMDRVAGGVGGIVKGLVSVIDLVLGFIGIKSNIAGVMGKVVGRTISGLMHVVGATVKPIFHILTIAGKLIGMALKPILTGIGSFAKIIGMIPWDKIADQIESGLKPLEEIFDTLDKAVDAFSKSIDWLFGDSTESPFDGASKALNGIKEFLEKLALLNPITLFSKGFGAVKNYFSGGGNKGGSAGAGTATVASADKGTKPAPAVQPSMWEKTKSFFGAESATTTASNSPQKVETSVAKSSAPTSSPASSPVVVSPGTDSTQTAGAPGIAASRVAGAPSPGAPATPPHVQTPFEHFTSSISDGIQSLFSPKKEEASSLSPVKTGAQSTNSNSPVTSGDKASEYARIGSVSAKLEAGGDAGTVNSAKAAAADNGGRSYGAYQMTTRDSKNPTGGTMKSFMNYLSTNNPQAAKKLEAAGGIQAAIAGDPKFISTFKELAKSDPKFADNQHAFIGQTHYEPAVAAANMMGANIDKRGDGVKQMIFSTAVNMGGANKVMKNAFKGMSPEQISKLSDQQFIQKYQAEKINNTRAYYSNPQSAAQNNARFQRETSMFLNPDKAGSDKNVLAGNSPKPQGGSPGFPSRTTEVAQSLSAASSIGGSVTGHMAPIPEREHERKMASVIQGTLVNTAYMGKYARAAAGIPEQVGTTTATPNYTGPGSRSISPEALAPSAEVSGPRLQQASADNNTMKIEGMKSVGHTSNINAPKSTVNHNSTQTGSSAKPKSSEDTYQRQMNQAYVLT